MSAICSAEILWSALLCDVLGWTLCPLFRCSAPQSLGRPQEGVSKVGLMGCTPPLSYCPVTNLIALTSYRKKEPRSHW